jgi:Zn-finger nucleic acid-binding protein
MPYCKSCAAPLPPYTSRCEYCGVKNDIDLKGISEFTVSQAHSERCCPLCTIPMETIGVNMIDNFYIERCSRCFGLFFDPEKLSVLLDKAVDTVYSINLQKIHAMNQMDSADAFRQHAYIKCPVSGELMNRVNFGARSGVVIDQCKHGVWLDNGELLKLLEWRKAGGQLLHEKMKVERLEREKTQREKEVAQRLAGKLYAEPTFHCGSDESTLDLLPILVSTVKLIFRLFR